MPTILITGASGVLGRALLRRPAAGAYTVRGTGRGASGPGAEWVRADLASGEGVDTAVKGADTIIHAASSPRGDTQRTDVQGTMRLIEAARRAGVRHVVYVSIVGIDRVPFAYYRHKLAAEREMQAGRVPWTILRGTQFHDFVDTMFSGMMKPPVGFVPGDFQSQPVHVDEFADALWECVAAGPMKRAPDVAGPQVLRFREMIRSWKAARGIRKPVIHLPLPGAMAAALRRGDGTAPEHAVGRVTWEE
ncbi:MAG: NAD(P)H-binding protein, partial [Gemmatimonadetes bacterium]|nr:NAD(P)H-binding protein [Gemmatimonadota bacterium]